jgi:adenosylcobyric acid synthase
MIEHRLGLPCAGVVPYLHDLCLEEEDSVSLENRLTVQRVWSGSSEDRSPLRCLRIGVIALPHMSNFTDFDALAAEPSVALAFIKRPKDVELADILILPGTKQTIDDLDWLSENEFLSAIHRHSAQNRPLIGLCGGFQMLGLALSDPSGVENDGLAAEREGLGLLSVKTVMGVRKITRPVTAEICNRDLWQSKHFQGYEIHMGDTYRSSGTPPFARLIAADGTQLLDGATSPSAQVFGTYVHGIFDNDQFRHDLLDWARASLKLAPAESKVFSTAEREARLNRWADHLRNSMKLDLIRDWLSLKTVA